MESETTIAQSIEATEEKERYDAACIRILSEKWILAWILKECAEEFEEMSVRKIAEECIEGEPHIRRVNLHPDAAGANGRIHGMSNEDKTLSEGIVSYDVRFIAVTPKGRRKIRMIINVEAQDDFYPGYPITKRAVYYCSRMISSQHGVEFTDSHYEDIKKVYSIWVCTNPPKNRKNTVTRYSLTEMNLVGQVKEKRENYDLLSFVMICLGDADSAAESNVLKLLNVLFSSETDAAGKKRILQDEFDIPMTIKLDREVTDMCNLSNGVERRGIEKGIKQGIKQGIEQGIEQGVQKGRHEMRGDDLRNLIASTGWTLERSMEVLRIPADERPVYVKMLGSS